MQTFVIVLTKDQPFRKKYSLSADNKEQVEEVKIENFEPYSRVVYLQAENETHAQRKLFDYMREYNVDDWKDLDDGIVID